MRFIESIKQKRLEIPLYLTSAGVICFLAMVWWYQSNGVTGLDESVIQLVNIIRRDWLTWIFRVITLFGSVTFIVIADLFITVLGIWKKHSGRDLLLLNLSNISGVILMQVLKMIFGRERPPRPWLGTASGFSFPSGHSLMTALFYGFLLYSVVHSGKVWPGRKRLIAILGSLPVLVGLSRVYLGVHYTSDVLAGWAAGVALVGVWSIFRELKIDQ